MGPSLPELLIFQEKGQILIFKCWQVIQNYLEHCAGPIYLWAKGGPLATSLQLCPRVSYMETA